MGKYHNHVKVILELHHGFLADVKQYFKVRMQRTFQQKIRNFLRGKYEAMTN